MRPPFGSGRELGRRPKLVAVTVANALPLLGVVALGWDVAALVTLYWLELGVLILFAVVRATFAGRPSEFDDDPLFAGALASKRVRLTVPRTDLGVRCSTLPVLAVGVPILALVWLFTGAMTVGVVGAETLGQPALETVVLAALGILLSEGATTVVEYFVGRAYREHSAQTAIQGVFMRAVALFFGGLFTALAVAFTSESVATDQPISAVDPGVVGAPLLAGIVLVKFGFDLAGVYGDRLAAFDERTGAVLGWAYEPPVDEPVDTDLAADATRVRPPLRGRLLGGFAHVRRRPGTWLVGAFALCGAGLFATGQVWSVALPLLAAAVVIPLALAQVDYQLRYAGAEYRTDGDAVVAYDRLFRTPLWRVEPWDETGLRVERDRVDEWLGTATVVVELRDETVRCPRLRDVDPILDAFDRRADRPHRSGE